MLHGRLPTIQVPFLEQLKASSQGDIIYFTVGELIATKFEFPPAAGHPSSVIHPDLFLLLQSTAPIGHEPLCLTQPQQLKKNGALMVAFACYVPAFECKKCCMKRIPTVAYRVHPEHAQYFGTKCAYCLSQSQSCSFTRLDQVQSLSLASEAKIDWSLQRRPMHVADTMLSSYGELFNYTWKSPNENDSPGLLYANFEDEWMLERWARDALIMGRYTFERDEHGEEVFSARIFTVAERIFDPADIVYSVDDEFDRGFELELGRRLPGRRSASPIRQGPRPYPPLNPVPQPAVIQTPIAALTAAMAAVVSGAQIPVITPTSRLRTDTIALTHRWMIDMYKVVCAEENGLSREQQASVLGQLYNKWAALTAI